MADKVIDIPGVGVVSFPESMSENEINAAATRAYQGANPDKKQPPVTSWAQTDAGAVPMAAAAKGLPAAATIAADFATSPTAAKTLGSVARGATTLAAMGHGLATGSPTEVLAAPMEGWAAGKGGYFLGKGMQSVAAPVASALEKAAPYAQGLGTLSGVQGALDLAQMAAPQRKDIGFLGVGTGDPGDPNHPALLNLIASKIGDAVKYLVDKGMSEKQAVMTVLNAKAKGL